MDIYRFFHPHHNPRLINTALRYTELSELLQAATELRKALERSQQRTSRRPTPPILPDHFTDVIKAARFIEASMQTLSEVHPGDSHQELKELVAERSSCSGWEAWTRNVQMSVGEGK
jgi:hypothetical protein